jgi:hypothetical protein
MNTTARTIWKFKSCPRYHGDLIADKEDKEEYCLQCGYRKDLKPHKIYQNRSTELRRT